MLHARPRRIPQRLGFTMVELLAVIGIVALLVALLLPALGRARRQAQAAACLSNLRQLSAAFLMYVGENRGAFPRPAQNTVFRDEDWIHFQTSAGRNFENGRVTRYIKFKLGVMRCPADDVATHRNFTMPNPPGGFWVRPPTYRYDFSYTASAYICRLAGFDTLKLHQIINPSEKILLGHESAETIDDGALAHAASLGDGMNTLSIIHNAPNERHGGPLSKALVYVAFADGRAAALSRAQSFDPRFFDPRFGR